ncbi:MAG: class I SAM-dependent methyltransferase [Mycobacteriales bacterium]
MTTASQTYTEQDVEAFFDETLGTYLSFWDADGVLHTGYFTGERDEDYRAASARTSEILAEYAEIDSSSSVLDVGCGCGNFLIELAQRFGCRGVGLDLSSERIAFAKRKLAGAGGLDVEFRHGSATRMPFRPDTFSHVVSQDALFLVPEKPTTHREVFRVLRPGGLFAFSDFLQPKQEVSERARKHVYDRVRWNGGYSLAGYQAALEQAGFDIVLGLDLASHLKQTYRVLGRTAAERAESIVSTASTASTADPADTTSTVDTAAARDWMLAFAESCKQLQIAIADGEFGWGMIVARKPAGRGAAR